MTPLTNALSFDVESFVESNLESFAIPEAFRADADQASEIEGNMRFVFDLLDEHGVRATFFFLGTVARRSPRLVAEAARRGHEVASHGEEHRRLFGMVPPTLRESLRRHKEELEDLAGVRVHGFRAPEFSITARTVWALDVVREVGFTYDSSVYPTGVHDVYGVAGATPHLHSLENGLVEFPPPTTSVLGRRIPFGGGGYFRVAPAALTERLIDRTNARGEPVILWLHPYEIGPVVPDVPGLSTIRRARHYANRRSGAAKLRRLFRRYRFGPAVDVLRERRMVAA
jgi:polysaccharide deacetylase family protein (PEP-CTERM system associated)